VNRLLEGYEGALAADALAMPVHWYYDREALRRDYGTVDRFMAPRNPHPGSILWRSSHEPLNERGDILREQARFWGQREVHYHQFLAAGENTLNYHDDFAAGITANAMVGGDNCHRGAVTGSLLGAACGVPDRFRIATTA
jgi:ADP-ribosylglycohydrolase